VTPEERKSDVAELNQTLKVSILLSKGARLKESVEEKKRRVKQNGHK